MLGVKFLTKYLMDLFVIAVDFLNNLTMYDTVMFKGRLSVPEVRVFGKNFVTFFFLHSYFLDQKRPF